MSIDHQILRWLLVRHIADDNVIRLRMCWANSASGEANPYGALDIAGNVWEWVADYYDERYYEASPVENPPGPKADTGRRVLRGSSWFQGYGECERAASRFPAKPNTRNFDVGFRCAQSP